jgi:hypothetical protein
VRTGEGAIYAVPPRTVEDLVARLWAPVTAVDANMLRRVQENAMWCTAFCLEIYRGHFRHLPEPWCTHCLITWQLAPFDGCIHLEN